MKKLSCLIVSVLFVVAAAMAQKTVTIDIPSFGNKKYVYSLSFGDKQDTILSGTLNRQGHVVLQIPAEYKDYVGVSQFRVLGGGLDIILNNEQAISVSVNTLVSTQTGNPLVFVGSPENAYMQTQQKRQQEILEKIKLMQSATQLYRPSEPFYSSIEKEIKTLETQYATLKKSEYDNVTLYAARFSRMVDFLMQTGSRLNMNEEEKLTEYRHFFLHDLDYNAAYTSSVWNQLIDSWMQMQVSLIRNDDTLVSDAQKILDRMEDDNTLKTAWIKRLMSVFPKYGKETLLLNLGIEDMVIEGMPAPLLQLGETVRMPMNAILFFYESGCGHCETELANLIKNYETIKAAGYKVIALAGDMDAEIFKDHSKDFPWKDTYCEFKSIHSVNFRNYGVLGTPTIFVIDEKGIVRGRYAQMKETGLF